MKIKSILSSFVVASLVFVATSCGGGGNKNIDIPGVQGPHYSIDGDQLLLSMVFENVQIDGGLRYKIPRFDNSYIELSPALKSDGTLFAIKTSVQDLLDTDIDTLDPQKLPGGRPLPGVVDGRLPAVAFSIEKFHNTVVYIGPDVYGVFVPASVGAQGAIASFRYYVKEKRAGTISLVGEDENGENAGILLLLDADTFKKFLAERERKGGERRR